MRIGSRLLISLVIPVIFLVAGCVLFDEVDYEESTNDYWSTGSCPGNTATDPGVVSTDCRNITLSGCCDIHGNTLYCYNGQLYCKSCAYNAPAMGYAACSWSTEENGYWCTKTDNGIEPTGTIPRSCSSLNVTP